MFKLPKSVIAFLALLMFGMVHSGVAIILDGSVASACDGPILQDKVRVSNLTGLREKLRKLKADGNKRISALESTVSDLKQKVASQELVIEEIIAALTDEDPDIPGTLPTAIGGADDLKSFITNHPDLGREWAEEYVSEKKIKCAKVRDLLAETYTNIERINDQSTRHDYTREDDGHRDAVLIIVDPADPGQDKVFDFCISSSNPGVLWDSLTWIHQVITPWGGE